MKRKDCFFGMHFDFHANASSKDIGKELDESVIAKIVDQVQPDFMQCDTKGHPGYCSYKTKLGNQAPGLVNDVLASWRKVTKERGIPLYSHYSGVIDYLAIKNHPEWGALYKDGTPSGNASLFGPYVDELMIPQLKELALDYGVDGMWVDGDCWALHNDYSDMAKNAWKQKTGKELKDLSPEEQEEFSAMQREAFYNYVRHYISEVKKVAPNIEITSNWINTAWAPDNMLEIDYISGDLNPVNCVDSARFEGRVMQAFGRNWDIMSWGHTAPIHHVKSVPQLCQEASIIIALGGGFQIYAMQSPKQTIKDEWAIPIWAEVSKFVRERKAYCHNGKVIHDIGVLLSNQAYYYKTGTPFKKDMPYGNDFAGMIQACANMGRGVDVIIAKRIDQVDLSEYKTIIVPNGEVIEQNVKTALLKYCADGGNLILSGGNSIKLFAKEFELNVQEPDTDTPVAFVFGEDYRVEVRDNYVKLNPSQIKTITYMNECLVQGDLKCSNPPPSLEIQKENIPAFGVKDYGKGKVGFIAIACANSYLNDESWTMGEFLSSCVNYFGEGKISVSTKGYVEAILSQKENKKYIHLINLLGDHRSVNNIHQDRVKTFKNIPPVYDTLVQFSSQQKPKAIRTQPENKKIKFSYKNGKVIINIPKIDLYTILEMEF